MDQRDPWREMVLGGLERPWPYGWVLARELPGYWWPLWGLSDSAEPKL